MKMGSLHMLAPFWGRIRAWEKPRTEIFAVRESSEEGILGQAGYSIIRLVELILELGYASRASDIHIDPRAHYLAVRERIDGVLRESHALPLEVHQELISRIKILSGLRIDEHHAAQDGRFRVSLRDRVVDVRVSVTPTYYGENAVLRILAETAEEFSLESLGFSDPDCRKIQRALKRPHGMILATGPTGSGKTTTMYTLLKMLNEPDISITTLEDPIEYSIPDITQIQIQPKSGLSFGNGLRSLLRQDPDVIMLGEIRDNETAGLAVNTALTGHRLLSTLHTNDAATTIARLLDMGIEPYLIASVLSLVIGQRLVRRICETCRQPAPLGEAERGRLQDIFLAEISPEAVVYMGVGCAECSGTGFFGRAGIYEVMEIPPLRDSILRKLPASEIQLRARQSGMTSLLTDGFHKVFEGVTTVEEIMRLRYE